MLEDAPMPTTLALPVRTLPRSLALALTPAPPPLPAPHPLPHPDLCHDLVCSHPSHQVGPVQPTLSLVTHSLAIAGIVWVTQLAPAVVERAIMDTTLMQLFQPAAVEKAPDAALEKLREERQANLIVIANPPPVGFQTVAVLAEIPKDIPPVDLNARPFDPRDFTGKGAEGGIADGVVGGTGKVTDLAATYAKGDEADRAERRRVFTSAELADPAQVISQPAPTYPRLLQQAGISGAVELQFIIDTLGRVEPASVKVLNSSHDPFAEEAVKAIKDSRFRPGRQRGEPIRQLVQQRVRFEAPETPPGL
jgi:protein TonB